MIIQKAIAVDSPARRGVRVLRGVLGQTAMLIRQYSLPRILTWEMAGVVLLVSTGVLAHAWNLFNYPRYQGDEGVYMSSAWSVTHGQIFPYTYSYGHPPVGWALIALWCQLTGGFFTFGTAIDTGRIFMLVMYAFSALFVYLIARRITGSMLVAVLATAIFSFSPLSVYFQREVLLDNIATSWMLLALYLQVASESRLRFIVGSALAFGISFLSKETIAVLLPVFIYGAWILTSKFQRRYLVATFSYISLALISSYILLAALKNELFPTGTLLGGTNPHVSMIATYLLQAGRGSSQGSFLEQWGVWFQTDPLITSAGVVAIAGNLLFGRRRPPVRIISLLSIIYFMFLARGGVTFAYYIIPLLPLLALNIAVFAYYLVSLMTRLLSLAFVRMSPRALAHIHWPSLWRGNPSLVRWIPGVVMLAGIALLVPYDLQANTTNLTANETAPQVAALQWIGQHVPRSARMLVSHYEWLDMHARGGLATAYGAPFDYAEMYWVAATDPAIGKGVFHDDWNTVDYVIADSDMLVDANGYPMPLVLNALKHSVAIKTFQNSRYWVTIYQVRHAGPTDSTAALAQAANQIPMSGGTAALTAPANPSTPAPPAEVSNNGALAPAGVTSPSSAPQPRVTVIAQALNVRAGPGLSYAVEGVVPAGTTFSAISERRGWLEVEFQGQHAWVAGWWTAPAW